LSERLSTSVSNFKQIETPDSGLKVKVNGKEQNWSNELLPSAVVASLRAAKKSGLKRLY
jgi:hypothetical protein